MSDRVLGEMAQSLVDHNQGIGLLRFLEASPAVAHVKRLRSHDNSYESFKVALRTP